MLIMGDRDTIVMRYRWPMTTQTQFIQITIKIRPNTKSPSRAAFNFQSNNALFLLPSLTSGLFVAIWKLRRPQSRRLSIASTIGARFFGEMFTSRRSYVKRNVASSAVVFCFSCQRESSFGTQQQNTNTHTFTQRAIKWPIVTEVSKVFVQGNAQ